MLFRLAVVFMILGSALWGANRGSFLATCNNLGEVVTVYFSGTRTTATLYSDNTGAGTALTNPFTMGARASSQTVFVDDGSYDYSCATSGTVYLGRVALGQTLLSNPNGYALAGSGLAAEIYNTAPAAGTASIAATTMVTPTVVGNYRFSYYLTQTAVGASCTGNSTVQIAMVYRDSNAAAAQTVNLGLHTVTTNGTVGVVPWTSGPTTWTARSGAFAVQFQTTYTLGTACSPGPAVQIFPVLEAL